MRIGIDGKCLLSPRAGVARYLEGVLAGLAAAETTVEVLRPESPRRTLPWVLWDLRRATTRFDVAHFPFYYPPPAPHCPVTVAIHDVLFLERPAWFPRPAFNTLRWMVPAGGRRAAAVVTFATATAARIEALCGVPRERIRVIPHGVDRKRFAPPGPHARAEVRRRLGLDRPYLLVLGALEPRRGTDLAVAATRALRARHPDLELAFAGELRSTTTEFEALPAGVRRLGRVADDDLPALLNGAAAVLAPSRGEGFDLPVLEALACGAPVVASDIDVHLEHFAPAVELFHSGDAEALAAAISRILDDGARDAVLRAGGPRHAARFSWESSARAHLSLWREVAR